MNSKSIEENFEIIERVGNGGYGSVYKVRNRLDDRIYAVKKIKLDCLDLQELDEEAQKVLKECRTLSLLDHPNILRYYGSWLVRARSKSIGEDFTSPHGRNSVTSSNNFTFGFKPRNDVGDERVSGILSFRRHNQQRPVHASQDEDNEPNEQSTPELYCKESPIYCKKIVPDDDDSSSGDSFTNRQTQLIERGEDVLYIQTEFCDLNLEQYLDERGLLIKECQKTLVTPGKLLRHDLEILPLLMYEAFSLGLQLIQALKYIHSKQKLIHRDLKPSNIFLNITSSRPLTRKSTGC
jgi:serine/threonine protein kinase